MIISTVTYFWFLVCLGFIHYFAGNYPYMRMLLSERNLVVVLFVMVLITFAMAHEDSKKMEKVYVGMSVSASSNLAQAISPASDTAPLE